MDITRHIRRGMRVDVLEKDGKAMAVHWEAGRRPGCLDGQPHVRKIGSGRGRGDPVCNF